MSFPGKFSLFEFQSNRNGWWLSLFSILLKWLGERKQKRVCHCVCVWFSNICDSYHCHKMQTQLGKINKCVCVYCVERTKIIIGSDSDRERESRRKKSNQIENLINKYYHKWNEFQTTWFVLSLQNEKKKRTAKKISFWFDGYEALSERGMSWKQRVVFNIVCIMCAHIVCAKCYAHMLNLKYLIRTRWLAAIRLARSLHRIHKLSERQIFAEKWEIEASAIIF